MKAVLIILLGMLSGLSNFVYADPTPERYMDFFGQAKQFIRSYEKPVTSDFRNFARNYLKKYNKKGEDCSEYKEATQLYIVDLNGDGQPEGLIAYTVEGCGGTNNAMRTIAVFSEIQRKWKTVGSIEIGTLRQGWDQIVEIQKNKIRTGNHYGGQGDQDIQEDQGSTYVFSDGVLRKVRSAN